MLTSHTPEATFASTMTLPPLTVTLNLNGAVEPFKSGVEYSVYVAILPSHTANI